MAQQTFSGVPGDFSSGQVLTAADMDLLREFLPYLILDGDETDTGEVSPLILDLGDNAVLINSGAGYTSTLGEGGLIAGQGVTIADRGAKTTAASKWVWYSSGGVSNFYYGGTGTSAGNKLILTADGTGQFAGAIALNGDTAAANQLDTYEEGVWSPTYISSNADMTSVVVNATFTKGTYVRIGRQVWVNGFIRTDSIGALGSGYAVISGLPFDSYNVAGYNAYPSAVHTFFAFDGDGPEYAFIPNNSGQVWLGKHGSGGAVSSLIDATDLSTAINRNGIAFQLTYITDAAA